MSSAETSPFMQSNTSDTKSPVMYLVYAIVVIVLIYIIYLVYNKYVAPGTWDTTEWSKCSVKCGGSGVQTRLALCSNSNCSDSTKPALTQPCGSEACWSTTDLVGGPSGSPFNFSCPENEYVNKMYLNYGSGVDQISVRCSGTKLNTATSNMYGGSGGTKGVFDFPDGIDSFYVTGGDFIGNVSPGTLGAPSFETGGAAIDQWKGTTKKMTCPPGSKVAGIYGKSDAYLNALGFNCQKS